MKHVFSITQSLTRKNEPGYLLFLALLAGLLGPSGALAGFMPPQTQIMSDMVLANNYFTNEWPIPGCNSCLPGGRASTLWTRGPISRERWPCIG